MKNGLSFEECIQVLMFKCVQDMAKLTQELTQDKAVKALVDFLNADLENPEAAWKIYEYFIEFHKKLGKLNLSDRLMNFRLMEYDEFCKFWDSGIWMRLQAKIMKVTLLDALDIESRKTLYDADIKLHSWIPRLTFMVEIKGFPIKPIDADNELRIDCPAASSGAYWLSFLMSGLIPAYKRGLRICEAPDCNKFFIPYERGKKQLYHSSTCRNRTYTRKRRRNVKD